MVPSGHDVIRSCSSLQLAKWRPKGSEFLAFTSALVPLMHVQTFFVGDTQSRRDIKVVLELLYSHDSSSNSSSDEEDLELLLLALLEKPKRIRRPRLNLEDLMSSECEQLFRSVHGCACNWCRPGIMGTPTMWTPAPHSLMDPGPQSHII